MTLLNVNDLALKLHCSIPTIYRYVSKRQIPYIKQGHRVLFIEEEVDNWILRFRVPVKDNLRGIIENNSSHG